MGSGVSAISQPEDRPELDPHRATTIQGGAGGTCSRDSTVGSRPATVDPVTSFLQNMDKQKPTLLDRKLNHLFQPKTIIDRLQVKTELTRIGTVAGVRKALSLDARDFLTIKLLIVPTGAGNAAQRFVASKFSAYGLVHVGLQINDKIVDWCNAGIVFIRPPQSSSAAALLDVRMKPGAFRNQHKATEELKQTICNLIVKWNVEKKYNSVNANCQTFVDEFLEAAGIKPFWPDCIGKYLADLKENPTMSKPHIREPDGTLVTFETHKQVDDYVAKLRGRPQLYEELQPLLKAFDRAFWLQEIKANTPPTTTCPFDGITLLPGMQFTADGMGDQKLKAELDAGALLGGQEHHHGSGPAVHSHSGPPPDAAKQLARIQGQDLSITVNQLQQRLETPMDDEEGRNTLLGSQGVGDEAPQSL